MNKYFKGCNLFLFDTFEGFDVQDLVEERAFENDVFNNGFFNNSTFFADTNVSRVLSRLPYKENVIIKKGKFPDTTKDTKFSLVILDFDLFRPSYEGLCFFVPRVNCKTNFHPS